MGLPALWDTIKRHEEVVPIAQLAEDHYRQHGKPLRVAVDEANWRFNNLTQQQVYTIRETSQQEAFQGIEKHMFYRLCRLLTLNIQLIFVFDGPGRPWKRGKRGQGRINYEERRLFQELLKYLGVPYHEAPGEAEADCARMQVLGIVDAVWSQDSDCLMFGCTLWFYDHRVAKQEGVTDRSKENTRKSGKYASVVRAEDLKEKHNLGREGLVLFAMLVGGDYDGKGLPQCGPAIALQAAKQELGKSLCACRNQLDCHLWSKELALFLQTTSRGRSIAVPSMFPDYSILKKYYSPKVTSDLDLLERSRLNLDYVRPIQEPELLKLTSDRFNIWGRLYMNWIGPVLLTRDLVSRDPSRPKEMIHDIRLVKRRTKQTEDHPRTRTFERKLTFSPFGVTSFGRADFEGSRFGHWNGNDQVPFDPEHRVECEIPEYWLRKALPSEVFDQSSSTPKRPSKRKRTTDDAEVEEASTSKRKRESQKGPVPNVNCSSPSHSKTPQTSSSRAKSSAESSKSGLPSTTSSRKPSDFIEISDSDEEEVDRGVSHSPLRRPSSLAAAKSLSDLSSPAPSSLAIPSMAGNGWEDRFAFDVPDEDDEDLQLALRLSMQEASSHTIPPSNKGKFDDIFALREAGRSVEGLPVPAWSLDQTTSPDLLSAIFPTPRQRAGSPTSARNDLSLRGIHANAARANSVEAPILTSPAHSSGARSLIPSPAKGGDGIADSKENTCEPTRDSLAEIRAARLRYFAASSPPTVKNAVGSASSTPAVKNTMGSAFSPAATSIGGQGPSCGLPADIECIDLTDD